MSSSTYYWRLRNSTDGSKQRNGRPGGRPIPGYSVTRNGRIVSDECIKELLLSAINGDAYPYGYRKLTSWLRREHRLKINKKKVYRLCKELGILRTQRRLRPRLAKRKVAMNREVTGVNQLWETDIKYGYIAAERRFFFVQTIMDVYDRMVIDYHIGLSCTAEEAAACLKGPFGAGSMRLGMPVWSSARITDRNLSVRGFRRYAMNWDLNTSAYR